MCMWHLLFPQMANFEVYDHNLRVLFSLKSLGYFFIQFMVGAMKLISACTPDNSTLVNYIQ